MNVELSGERNTRGGRAERRLAAIMALDVVGYSRLMGLNEEGTHTALKAIWREITDPGIHEHHGRIVKTMGDGLLVEFASVVDAVRCAVDIQRKMQRRHETKPIADPIRFRIGINVGDIIIDEADIFGDGVNIAARIEGLAEPGGICVSRIVRDQVRDKLGFGFEDLGQRRVKNIARPVHVFKIPLASSSSAVSETGRSSAANSGPPRAAAAPRWFYLAGALGGGTAILFAGSLLLRLPSGPAATPPPLVGDPVFFDPGKVALSQWARATLAQQADFLHNHPTTKVTVRTYCANDEGGRAGLQVLAQLRANQIRDALEAQGIDARRIRLELGCGPSDALPGSQKTTSAQTPRALLIRN
jgi:class 3 adenylate cyclase